MKNPAAAAMTETPPITPTVDPIIFPVSEGSVLLLEM